MLKDMRTLIKHRFKILKRCTSFILTIAFVFFFSGESTHLYSLEISRKGNPTLASETFNEDIRFPLDAFAVNGQGSGMIDVTQPPYNAKGDGRTDDTAAIQRAIYDTYPTGMLYLPQGTYLVSNTLEWIQSNGQPRARLTIHGQGRDKTIIKLKNNASGFQYSNKPKPVIQTRGWKQEFNFEANRAFYNSLYYLTVDTGSNNPGAVGISWMVSNEGTLRHVYVKSSDGKGVTGIQMLRDPGPGLLYDVRIDGFNYGIDIGGNLKQSITAEQLVVRNQQIAGIRNRSNTLNIHDLQSFNTVPAILHDVSGNAQTTVVDAILTGGASSKSAIFNRQPAKVFVRNLTASGYGKVIDNASNAPAPDVSRTSATTNVNQWLSHDPVRLFDTAPSLSLGLEIKTSPEYHSNNFGTWANVMNFSDNGTGDDAVRIQKAIDSGAETIYFPTKSYTLNSQVIVRGNVIRMLGLKSAVFGRGFRIDNTTGSFVILEQFTNSPSSIEINTPKTVVIRDLHGFVSNTNRGTGNIFIENVAGKDAGVNGGVHIQYGAKAWIRQLNPVAAAPEANGMRVLNDNSTVWIMGITTEHNGNIITTRNGGRTEVLGAQVHANYKEQGNDVAYLVQNGKMSIISAEVSFDPKFLYKIWVEETRNGQTRRLLRDSPGLQVRGRGRIIPLFVSG